MKKRIVRLFAIMLALSLLWACFSVAGAEEAALTIKKWKKLTDLCQQIDDGGAPKIIDISSQSIGKDDLTALMARYPDTAFQYRLRVLKRNILWNVTELDLGYGKFENMDELLEYLPFFPRMTSVTSLGTPFTYDEMEKFSAAYPDVKYLFKIHFGRYNVRSDITAFCTKHALYTKTRYDETDFIALKYCRDLKALDFGHNAVTDLSFLRELPKLQILICVDNKITDLTPLEAQTELEYLECFLNPGITDVTALSKLPKLMDLHISHCSITDITPLYGLKKLDRLWLAQNQIPQEQIDRMQALLPDCTINNTVDVHPTAEGWRQGHPRYLKIQKMFGENRYVEFP